MERDTEIPRFVIDASIATKWHLRDEDLADQADRVLADFAGGRINLVAPEYIRYEVPAAFRNALRNHRLARSEVDPAIYHFFRWNILTVPCPEEFISESARLGVLLNCSLYDALYLHLAESVRCPVIYADNKLRKNLGDQFPLALWIENYRSP